MTRSMRCEDSWPWKFIFSHVHHLIKSFVPKNMYENLCETKSFLKIEFWAACHKIFLFGDLVSWIPSQNMSEAQIPGIITVLWLRLVWIFWDHVNCLLICLISQISRPGRRLFESVFMMRANPLLAWAGKKILPFTALGFRRRARNILMSVCRKYFQSILWETVKYKKTLHSAQLRVIFL